MPASQVFHKFGKGTLRSSSGQKVTSHQQAIAIYMSEKRNEAKHGGKYKEGVKGKHIRKR